MDVIVAGAFATQTPEFQRTTAELVVMLAWTRTLQKVLNFPKDVTLPMGLSRRGLAMGFVTQRISTPRFGRYPGPVDETVLCRCGSILLFASVC